MFSRYLVAIDGSDNGSAAIAFASDAARQFEGSLKVVQVMDGTSDGASTDRAGASIHPLPGHRIAEEIAKEADRYEADVIVLGLDRGRLANHRFARGIRQQLNRASTLPVLIAPGM